LCCVPRSCGQDAGHIHLALKLGRSLRNCPHTCCQRLIGNSSGTARPSQPGMKAATQHPSRVTKPTHRPLGWQALFRCPPYRQQLSIRHGCVWLASCRCSLRWHFAAELCVAILPATIRSRCEPRQNILS
jgi:hypothetical protein